VPSTVDADALAGDKVGLDEEENRLGDFLGAAPAGERRGLDSLGILLGGEVGRGQNGAGRDGIDENLGSQVEREALGKRRDRSLGYVIRYVALVPRTAADGSQSAKLTMRPPPLAFMTGAAWVENKKALFAFVSSVPDQSAPLGLGVFT
jgi:hypothetical protein